MRTWCALSRNRTTERVAASSVWLRRMALERLSTIASWPTWTLPECASAAPMVVKLCVCVAVRPLSLTTR